MPSDPLLNYALDSLSSRPFIEFIKKFAERIKKARSPREKIEETKKSLDKTLDALSERQTEAIELEHVYLNLLDMKFNEEQAKEMLTMLGYKTGPHPLLWLKNKIKDIREWIIDAIKWLRILGKELGLLIKEIIVEIGLIPKVSIIFIPTSDT